MKGLTKALLGMVAAFALVAAIVRFWPAPPPAQAAPTPNPHGAAAPTSAPGSNDTGSSPPGTVNISILTTDTKAEWLDAVTKDFNAAHKVTAKGQPIQAKMLQVSGPDEMMQSILKDSRVKPVLWSPDESSWIDQANQLLKNKGQDGIVKAQCPPVAYTPTGFAMWRSMAEALGWPDRPIGWQQIVELAGDPHGWAKYGHPEWGQFTFGHSHPEQPSTGFDMLASLAYAAAGKNQGLEPQDVKSDAVKDAFRKVEKDTYHYGLSSRDLQTLMAQRGPAYLHAVTTSETALLKQNEVNKETLRSPLVFIFPAEGGFWSDNPTCILQASWVSPEQREAAQIYRDFLLAPAQQDKAVQIGLRPAARGIALHCPICLDNGTDPGVTPRTAPRLAPVSGETNTAIIDVFKETKKKATVILVLDTSSSMQGAKIKSAIEGSKEFLNRLDRNDVIVSFMFGSHVTRLDPSGRVGNVVGALGYVLSNLSTEGNTTVLYDALCTAVDTVDQIKADDKAAGDDRLYRIVVLSDGRDTNSKRTANDMLACLPKGEDVEGTKVYTIAYGDDADNDLLQLIANRTNGKTFAANPSNIKQIYLEISAQQ